MVDIEIVLNAERISSQLTLAVTKLVYQLREENNVYISTDSNRSLQIKTGYATISHITDFEILCPSEMTTVIFSELDDLRREYIEKQKVVKNPKDILLITDFSANFSFAVGKHGKNTSRLLAKLTITCEIGEP